MKTDIQYTVGIREIVFKFLKTGDLKIKAELTTCELAYCARQNNLLAGGEVKKKRIKGGGCC
jgi:hypothetical protein